jgi:HPt (histidine-containing phosphotransfer) domain-containing protein
MPSNGEYHRQFTVHPEPELADLIPRYLERRRSDAEVLEAALLSGDMDTVRSLGHSMKGSGGGYGFDGITEIGHRLEAAGRDADAEAARDAVADLRAYLVNVEVVCDQ